MLVRYNEVGFNCWISREHLRLLLVPRISTTEGALPSTNVRSTNGKLPCFGGDTDGGGATGVEGMIGGCGTALDEAAPAFIRFVDSVGRLPAATIAAHSGACAA